MVTDKGVTVKVLGLLKTSVGAEWAVRQTRHLVKLGVDVHVALPLGGPRVAEYQEAGVTVHALQPDFPLRDPWRFPALRRALRALVDEVQPDIIHSYFVGTTLTMRLALGRSCPIPRVFQVPGPLHLEHPFYRRAEIATAGPVDYWIGTCHWIAQRYCRSGIAPERIFVSNFGVDLDAYACPQRGKLRRELGVDETLKLVGMVGYMYAPKRLLGQTRGIKGHEDLIDALAICLKREPSVMGVFIGGAWDNATAYERRVRAYARHRCGDRAVFLGTRGDVAALVPDLDVAVQPSHSESAAHTAVEAQLLGVPVVATQVGGLPDLIKHGETGWLVPPRSPARLAEAILEALGDPDRARTLACAGRERAAQFDSAKNTREVLEIYRTTLSGARVHARRRRPVRPW
jgi:glycosyltransferase involved in cell wall biosynthesis